MQNGYDTRNAIQELIDTLWNVNLNSATAIVTPAAAGINRYIMECK